MLCGENIRLRALEAEDIDLLYRIENDMGCWGVSGTLTPFSRYQLAEYLALQGVGDIYSQRQLRLVVERIDGVSVGLVDLYDFDPHHMRAGVGIIIEEGSRGKGYATEALRLMVGYSRDYLLLHQLWASVAVDNLSSVKLFLSLGFEPTALRRAWIRSGGEYIDEQSFQLIL